MASTLTVDTIQGSTTADNVKLPEGSILQTVTKHFVDTTAISDYGTTFTDITNGNITITPKYNNSKILIIPNIQFLMASNKAYLYGAFRLLRGTSTVISPHIVNDGSGGFDYGVGTDAGSYIGQFEGRYCGHHIDTPNTTSAVTYKFQGISYTSGRTITINYQGTPTSATSSIIAMEISV